MFIFITLPSKQSPHNPCLSNNPPVIPNTLQAKASGAVLDGFFHTYIGSQGIWNTYRILNM